MAGDDLSDMFQNPAGMALVNGRGFQAGVTLIDSQSEFSGNATPFGGPSADGGATSLVPNLFYLFPESGAVKFGIGITAPSDWQRNTQPTGPGDITAFAQS